MTTSKLSRRTALVAGLSTVLFPHVAWPQSTERDVEGGIGGTGIVGILTDFGSLIVSGNLLQTDGSTRFSDGFGQINESDLKIGDSLTIEAAGPPEALLAKRVHVTHPLVGKVSAQSQDGLELVVNGVTCRLENPAADIGVGDRVAVSGLWRGRMVIASRVSRTRSPRDLISGDVQISFGRVRIGPVNMRGPGMSGLVDGSFATAIGRFEPTQARFVAESLTATRFVGAAGALAQLSIEGYLDPVAAAPGYRVAGLGHSFARNLQLDRYEDTRVLFNGPYTGRFAANRAVVLPERFQARRSLLATLSKS
ncbi:DUF5666 domain-containing protein [uncultured Roseobacter sp.]|uniref:DUF5666 domain-containing protein n=1 Tax=uncultured Roseobacter sp. TaxID=114847 RepID=UPI00261C094A|nr:DUF5666 domain-containing protein [uncultured Roseobacter sp.]